MIYPPSFTRYQSVFRSFTIQFKAINSIVYTQIWNLLNWLDNWILSNIFYLHKSYRLIFWCSKASIHLLRLFEFKLTYWHKFLLSSAFSFGKINSNLWQSSQFFKSRNSVYNTFTLSCVSMQLNCNSKFV